MSPLCTSFVTVTSLTPSLFVSSSPARSRRSASTRARHSAVLNGSKFGNVTLKRGITDSMDIYNWHKDIVAGKIHRETVAIVAIDEAGADKARFEIAAAWPSKYDPMDLNAKGNDVAIETLELVNEGVQRVA